MPAWGNTDALADKPRMVAERTARPQVSLAANVASFVKNGAGSTVAANANTIFLPDTSRIVVGMEVSGNNISFNTEGGFFLGNTTVKTVNAANVVLNPAPGQQFALSANIVVGDYFAFSNSIAHPAETYESTYNQDTILVTNSRLANATVNVNHAHAGWTHVRKKINGDGTVRYLSEVLVATSNASASNTSSANTSNTQVYTGV